MQFAVLMTEMSFSQEKAQLIPIADLLIANPQNYAGQTILVQTWRYRINPIRATGSFKLIEGKTLGPAKPKRAGHYGAVKKGVTKLV